MAKMANKFICKSCGYKSPSWFGMCPACKSYEVEEFDEKPAVANAFSKATNIAPVPTNRIGDSFKNNEDATTVLRTFDKFPGFNGVLSSKGGLIESQVVLLGAAPGTGKSTLMSQICDKNSLYISSEETQKQVSARFKRCNCDLDSQFLESTDQSTILNAISTTSSSMIVLDSLNSISSENFGLISYAKAAELAQQITRICKTQNKTIIIISQVTRNNNVIGMESTQHAVDTILHMERSSVNDNIILTSSKNRFGEVGEVVFLHHEEDGLHEVENICSEENLVGTTRFRMISGSKKIPMELQALVVPTTEKPMRRGIGVNFNKLYVIDAILKANDRKYNTSESDIFVSTSSGMILPEGNDIVIANSLLSAYYNKVLDISDLDYFKGLLNLNGIIIGNPNFRHIRDLINLYR